MKLKLILRHKHTGKCYAVKISKREMNGHEGMRDDEIQILIKFGQHPNIITVKVFSNGYLPLDRVYFRISLLNLTKIKK